MLLIGNYESPRLGGGMEGHWAHLTALSTKGFSLVIFSHHWSRLCFPVDGRPISYGARPRPTLVLLLYDSSLSFSLPLGKG